jgi:penicillin-binding protein 1A
MAYHLTRKWSKQKILRNYLNSIYFGNGAYGIESAARTYFGSQHVGCENNKSRPCAAQLEPAEAALIAGVVSSPSAYDPVAHPAAAKERRDLVLLRMFEQKFIAQEQYDAAVAEPIPSKNDIEPPREETKYPYFTSWIKQQVVDKLGGGQTGARQAFEGGLRIETTIDGRFQKAADDAIRAWLPYVEGPRASLVAIENKTGEVRAMVGGDDYNRTPFNLATQGQRQPGSAFKPFVLAEAMKRGISPTSLWSSRKKVFDVPGSTERFTVANYEDAYAGVVTLAQATVSSDNSVYAEVGIKTGTKRIAKLARRMGIRTPVSDNWAMTLGGLEEGVTPLDMAHAYETFAQKGKLTYGSMSPGRLGPDRPVPGPVGIEAITRQRDGKQRAIELPNGDKARNKVKTRQVLDEGIANSIGTILQGVVKNGTAQRAQLPNVPVAGKTGTTENYGDAWFVGWTPKYTVAVWVGYPKRFQPMKTEFRGDPVAGGTYPAGIWKTFMEAVLRIDPPPKPKGDEAEGIDTPVPGTTTPAPAVPAPQEAAPETSGGGETAPAQPVEPEPEPQQQEEAPAEEPPAAPEGGTGETTPPSGGTAPPAEGTG